MTPKHPKAIGAWVGLRRCGCCMAVASVTGVPAYDKFLESTKRGFLKSGLSVVYVSWDDYINIHSKTLQFTCPHTPEAPPQEAELPL